MKQFEIWWADLPAPVGRRPVVLLTRTPAVAYLNKVIVVEVTTTIRDIAQEVRLGEAEGLPLASVANFDNVHVVAKRQLTLKAGELSSARILEAKRALGHALGWVELMGL